MATGRFAPSPTGDLHLGSLRTALLAWLFARSGGGRFLVRIEDLDVGRVVAGADERQLADLEAIGLDWDEPPAYQSRRLHGYASALARLTDAGRTYPCFCSRADVRAAASAPHDPEDELRYPGTCRNLDSEEAAARIDAGTPHCVRLRSDLAGLAFADRVLGEVRGRGDDIVIVRRDGAFAYNLAVVVDDAAQGVDEVVRGADLATATPAQLELQTLLGLPTPTYVHVPVLLGPDGSRLAKRHGSVTLADLAAEGHDPSDVRGMLAASVGLADHGERPSPTVLLDRFDPDAIPAQPTMLSR